MSSTSNDDQQFEIAMLEMAADPEIQAECRAIEREFTVTESDGLPDD
jgi:hypothetical protein